MAPIVKFVYHTIAFAAFLLLISYTLLIAFYKDVFEWNEMVLGIWIAGFMCDEIAEIWTVSITNNFLSSQKEVCFRICHSIVIKVKIIVSEKFRKVKALYKLTLI